MTITTEMPATSPAGTIALDRRMILTLAAGAGFSVASLYYSQPLLGLISNSPMAASGGSGWIPMLTQAGYAAGILLLAPLGDRYNRRILILIKAVLLILALAACGLAPNMTVLLISSFVTGVVATMAQDIIPAAATLSPVAQRGKAVGNVMTGLLLGILLSRVLSGLVAGLWGWRIMFGLAALSIVLITLILARRLPDFAPTTSLSWPALMRSLAALWRQHPALRQAVIAQGALSLGFSAFWSTMAIMLDNQYHLGSGVAGTFGLAGAAGALAAPLAGFIADRNGPAVVTRYGCALATLAFAAMFALPWLSVEGQLILLALSVIGFDFGVQSSLVAHQSIIYQLDPPARSRLNAVLFTGVFLGMSLGALLGDIMLKQAGWNGVVWVSVSAGVIAFATRMVRRG